MDGSEGGGGAWRGVGTGGVCWCGVCRREEEKGGGEMAVVLVVQIT